MVSERTQGFGSKFDDCFVLENTYVNNSKVWSGFSWHRMA